MIIIFLDDLKDNGRLQGQGYELKFILLFSIMAILSNSKSYRDIARFMKKNHSRLNNYFGQALKKAPSYATVRNIIQGTDKQGLEACFRAYSKSLSEPGLQ